MQVRAAIVLATLVASAPRAYPAIFTVTSTANGGPGTLRQAILDANDDSDPDTIVFAIGTGARTIAPTSPLPGVTNPVTIDGTTQPGFAGTPLIEIDGENANPSSRGIALVEHSGSTVRGLVINRFTDTGTGSGYGILLSGGGGHTIRGNYIGTDVSGTLDRGNGRYGIACILSSGSTIGGTTLADRNVIAANPNAGIQLRGASNNVVQGNWIGVTAAGSVALGNGDGIFVLSFGQTGSTGNTIGGDVPAAANVISGNDDGIVIGNDESSGNVVKGNLIGTDATGTSTVGNTQTGISVNSAPGVTIERNLIAGSGSAGIDVRNAGADDIVIRANTIGSDATETAGMGNEIGVLVSYGPSGAPNGVTIGGDGAGNLITHSADAGIAVVSGFATGVFTFAAPRAVEIRGNAIIANGGLGIDLENDGITTNDLLDVDGGANRRQNFPELTGVVDLGDTLEVAGTLDAAPGTTYRVEIFVNAAADESGNGEGADPLGTTLVATGPTGHGVIDVLLPAVLDPGAYVTATATDPAGNTSEFSAAFAVSGLPASSTSTTTSSTTTSTEEPTTTTSSTSSSTAPASSSTTSSSSSTSSTTTSSSTSSSSSSSTTSSTLEPTTTTAPPASSTTTATPTTSTLPATTSTSTSIAESTTSTSSTSSSSSSSTTVESTTTSSTAESTTSTSTTLEPTTTAPSSTTIASTTSSTSTSGASTTSTTASPSTTTTSRPVASTTTTVIASTTTTTLGCSMAEPLPGLECRLEILMGRFVQVGALGTVQAKMQLRLEQAGARIEEARQLCLLGRTPPVKRKLTKASRALAQFSKTLRSRKAKVVSELLRSELTTRAEGIRADLGLVKLALVCE